MGEACTAATPGAANPYTRRRPERTVPYRAVSGQLETSLQALEYRGRSVLGFVREELRAFLRCGILKHGCCRVRCTACGHSKVVAFSCKCRGFCPSCAGRRMASTAKHVVERVWPERGVRQWVLSFPWGLRRRIAYDKELAEVVRRVWVRSLHAFLRKRAKRQGLVSRLSDAETGTITFPQRFGSSLNLNVHFHTLALDGVYTEDDGDGDAEGFARWHDLEPPFEHHNLRVADLESDKFKLGGVVDHVLRLGYGMRHHVTYRVDIDWNVQGRYVWLFEDTQRQVRGSVRLLGRPGRNPAQPHRLGLELVGFVVHRDESQFGNDLQCTSAVGQLALTYEWMSRRNLGPFTKARLTSSLFTGEAPVYEVREEALNNLYAKPP